MKNLQSLIKEQVEILAVLEHEQWAHWMKFLYKQCRQQEDGSLIIPVERVSRWGTLMELDYSELTEKEKESDREWARKIVPTLETIARQTAESLRVEKKEKIGERVLRHEMIGSYADEGFNVALIEIEAKEAEFFKGL